MIEKHIYRKSGLDLFKHCSAFLFTCPHITNHIHIISYIIVISFIIVIVNLFYIRGYKYKHKLRRPTENDIQKLSTDTRSFVQAVQK